MDMQAVKTSTVAVGKFSPLALGISQNVRLSKIIWKTFLLVFEKSKKLYVISNQINVRKLVYVRLD